MINMVEKEESVISEEEAAQYDRQIRLWGLDAQKRLRGSRVLLVGMKGLGAEVAKNLILAGVKALTMLDHEQITEEVTRSQFLIPVDSSEKNRAHASLERAQYLNPMVEVKADNENVENKSDDFFLQFDAVCLTCCSRDLMIKIDQLCHKHQIKFFAGDVFGYHGFTFADLGVEHEFVEEKPKMVKPSQEISDGPEAKKPKIDPNETMMVKKISSFCQLKDALENLLKRTPNDYFLLQGEILCKSTAVSFTKPSVLQQVTCIISDLLFNTFVCWCFSEMAPVCAVVGGVLGQEIVKALSQRDAPHRNFFFFDGIKGSGVVDCLGVK
uniref:SUMO-activating enzyme subunit 1 n=1 Tax=Erpetoichthys calabaricus TaxID=27687 RepID=A0A8C4X2B1_ERPCA